MGRIKPTVGYSPRPSQRPTKRPNIKWCSMCSRYHPRRVMCELYLRERIAKSGRKVARWCH